MLEIQFEVNVNFLPVEINRKRSGWSRGLTSGMIGWSDQSVLQSEIAKHPVQPNGMTRNTVNQTLVLKNVLLVVKMHTHTLNPIARMLYI